MPKVKFKTREEWLLAFTEMSRHHFKRVGAPLPKEVRCSVGFPSAGGRSKVIGECWASIASADKHAEIFIRPSLQSDSSRVADVLTHELIHAALGHEEGHGKEFKRVATELGLTGKMTATVAGPEWHKWADPILKEIGPMPGAALADLKTKGGKKKQTTRMLKLTCPDCGWLCRTSAAHIYDEMACPLPDCDGQLTQD